MSIDDEATLSDTAEGRLLGAGYGPGRREGREGRQTRLTGRGLHGVVPGDCPAKVELLGEPGAAEAPVVLIPNECLSRAKRRHSAKCGVGGNPDSTVMGTPSLGKSELMGPSGDCYAERWAGLHV